MKATARVFIGTAGFSYKDWLGNFYPQFVPPADFLKFYASKFRTVEIDSTFYRIPSAETVAKWARQTPERFVFAAKFPQTVTHEGPPARRVEDARVFIDTMRGLGDKLGPLLLQFPYSFKPAEKNLLADLLAAVPADIRVSVELRNGAWLSEDDLFARLRQQNIALCLIDHPWMPRLTTCTADFVYIRFLGDRKKIEEDFSYVRDDRAQELAWWRELIDRVAGEGKDLYAYFNNHYSGHAPSTAFRLMEMLDGMAPDDTRP
ncbi:MAG TPA: DUF72 domain-containing protein [candidate division Zixibacteria bacterium]|nr:DUF72 domain-containing protein [candidate division Zixibacteria bacterium]MDD4918881.1 DUF72 domain-containing protein [candidate division Zixibacteria bacterium]MDM7973875.1 DUF72 domain-containing protein [candidate division Zixibacteria bacterium]HOD67648.1 DUF72 domain-containing protein [candidate division Zixibacteria bacterium]HPM36005.1 DUF72 domain-containing protein [candidate division Zixibacteria bacterium]